jgi:hypothetical protein
MKIKALIIFSIIAFSSASQAIAQNTTANNSDPLTTGSIKEQFDYAIDKSSQYEDKRVIKTSWMTKLRTNIADTISKRDMEIKALIVKSTSQQNQIDSLKSQLRTTNENLVEARTAQNSLSFLGIQLEKGAYQSLTLSIIILLIIGFSGIFYMFKRNHQTIIETNNSLIELQKEFDAHRKRTLEREQTMARNHLSELNKLRNK